MRLKSVVDGKQVHIPAPKRLCDGVTQEDSESGVMVITVPEERR